MVAKKTSKVAIANQKGGVGKTACTVNLAASYAKLGMRVLVVDMDPQCDATGYFGLEDIAEVENKHLANAIKNNLSMQQIRMTTAIDGVDILAGSEELRSLQQNMEGDVTQHLLLDSLLSRKIVEEEGYDLVLIDTHPSMDCLLVSALCSADYYLIPLFPERRASKAVSTMITFADKIRKLNPMLMLLGCIITKFDKRSATHVKFESILREGSKNGNIRIFGTNIPSSTTLQGSESTEKPLILYKPSTSVSDAYLSLAGEIKPELIGKRQGKIPTPKLPAIQNIPDDFEIEVATEL
jgi:chromosome partitioning protein